MKRFLVLAAIAGLVAIVGLRLSVARPSGNSIPDMTGHWVEHGDYKLNGEIDPGSEVYQLNFVAGTGGKFSGTYIKPLDPSQFDGQFYSSPRGVVLSMVQVNKTTNYFATYNGFLVSENRIKGTWVDVDGKTGDFLLEKNVGQ